MRSAIFQPVFDILYTVGSGLVVKLDFCIDVESNPIGVKGQSCPFRVIMTELDIITGDADFFKAYEPSIERKDNVERYLQE